MSGFFILRKLAEGPATEVFLVHLGGSPQSRRVAEVLRPELTEHPEIVGRFMGEAQLRLREGPPGMLPWTEVGEDPDHRPYVLSAPLPTENLRTRLMKRGPLELEAALAMASTLTRTLLSRGGSPFARLSPEWIWLGEGDDLAGAKLVEFGLTLSPLAQARMPAWVPPEYRAPEVIRGERPTSATDVYGVGLVLYEALTGSSPTRGLTPDETLRRQVEREAPRLPDRVSSASNLVAKCLAKNPGERWQSLAELDEALVRALAGAQLKATSRRWTDEDVPSSDGDFPPPPVVQPRALPRPAESAPAVPRVSPGAPEPRRGRWMVAAVSASLLWVTAAVPRHLAPLEPEETPRAYLTPREPLTLRSYFQDCLKEAPRTAARLLRLSGPTSAWLSENRLEQDETPERCAMRVGLLFAPYGQGHRPKPRVHPAPGPSPRMP